MSIVELIDTLGSDLTVVNAARVSFSKHKDVLDMSDTKLLSYLAKHRHISPFTHPQIQFRIKMPIFIARQWFKHTIGLTRNEVSRRYVSGTPEMYLPTELRKAGTAKQGSLDEASEHSQHYITVMDMHFRQAVALYDKMIADGICAEQARMLLPQAMYTEFYETGSLAAYARIIYLRSAGGAQKEIREYSHAVETILKEQFPHSMDALLNT